MSKDFFVGQCTITLAPAMNSESQSLTFLCHTNLTCEKCPNRLCKQVGVWVTCVSHLLFALFSLCNVYSTLMRDLPGTGPGALRGRRLWNKTSDERLTLNEFGATDGNFYRENRVSNHAIEPVESCTEKSSANDLYYRISTHGEHNAWACDYTCDCICIERLAYLPYINLKSWYRWRRE